MSNLGFDATTHERSEDNFEAFEGDFIAVIEDTEDGRDAGKGWLKLTVVVKGPTHEGRKLWTYLNLWNDNLTAAQIAKDELYDICQALGMGQVQNHEDLRYKELGIKVKIEKRKDTGEDQSRIKKFYSKNKVSAAATTQAASGSAPWDKK